MIIKKTIITIFSVFILISLLLHICKKNIIENFNTCKRMWWHYWTKDACCYTGKSATESDENWRGPSWCFKEGEEGQSWEECCKGYTNVDPILFEEETGVISGLRNCKFINEPSSDLAPTMSLGASPELTPVSAAPTQAQAVQPSSLVGAEKIECDIAMDEIKKVIAKYALKKDMQSTVS